MLCCVLFCFLADCCRVSAWTYTTKSGGAKTRRAVGNAERELEIHTVLNCKRFVSESENPNPSNTRYTRYTLHAATLPRGARASDAVNDCRAFASSSSSGGGGDDGIVEPPHDVATRRMGNFIVDWEIAKHNLAEPSEQKSTKTRSESKRQRERERAREQGINNERA